MAGLGEKNKKAVGSKEELCWDRDGKIIPMITYRLGVGKKGDWYRTANIVGAVPARRMLAASMLADKLCDSFST